MLQSLFEKIKAATQKWWKWILGGIILIIIVFVIWKMKRQADRIALLEAQKQGLIEKQKDIEAEAKNATDQALIDGFNAEIDNLKSQIGSRQAEIDALAKDNETSKKTIDDIKTWKDLEKQAKGK